ncbi:MAG TPA: hypothetical protein PKC18_19320, partial [Lacipirellulaceae bacterium]|nr:hypothetical protein [Lacipirellulaceae bacterium]
MDLNVLISKKVVLASMGVGSFGDCHIVAQRNAVDPQKGACGQKVAALELFNAGEALQPVSRGGG